MRSLKPEQRPWLALFEARLSSSQNTLKMNPIHHKHKKSNKNSFYTFFHPKKSAFWLFRSNMSFLVTKEYWIRLSITCVIFVLKIVIKVEICELSSMEVLKKIKPSVKLKLGAMIIYLVGKWSSRACLSVHPIHKQLLRNNEKPIFSDY